MTINTALLRQLSNHLRNGQLGHKNFDFSCFNADECTLHGHLIPSDMSKCGTNGCAIGECPIVFPEHWSFGAYGCPGLRKPGSGSGIPAAMNFFQLTTGMAEHLFVPRNQTVVIYGGKYLGDRVTKEQVADNIDAFCDLAEAGKFG